MIDVIHRVLWMYTEVMGWCNYLHERDRRTAAKSNSQEEVKAPSRHSYYALHAEFNCENICRYPGGLVLLYFNGSITEELDNSVKGLR